MKKTLHIALLLSCAITFAGCKDNSPPEVPDAELVGTLWTLESIEVPGEPDFLPVTTQATSLKFLEDYRFEGHLDCNSYYGNYTLTDGDSIQVDIQFITEMLCGTSNDGNYLVHIRAVDSYGIIGNQLRLQYNNSVLKYRYME